MAAWLTAHKRYPEQARRRGEEGQVAVRFTVAADGRVIAAEIVRGSGSDLLDRATSDLLSGARLPPPGTEVTRTVRIRYRLE
jgi:protein TonB